MRGALIRVSSGAAILLLLGFALVAYGGYDYVERQSAAEDAVSVEGTIVEADFYGTDSNGGSYSPSVEFTYRYEGVEYTGWNVRSGSDVWYETRSEAESALTPYTEGETVTVYVFPESPGDGFLEHQPIRRPLTFVATGAAILLVTSLYAVGVRWSGRRAARRPGTEAPSPRGGTRGVDRTRFDRLGMHAMLLAAAWLGLSLLAVSALLRVSQADSGDTPPPIEVGLTDPLGVLVGIAALAMVALLATGASAAIRSNTE